MIEENITFASGTAILAGTLTFPSNAGVFPAALLIPGSGQIDRNENHKKLKLNIFNHLASYLANQGIATLRYDKRGIGQSNGDFFTASFHDNVLDAEAALEFMRTQEHIDSHRLFLIGHSEGAIIATLLASKDKKLAGTILLAGTACNGENLLKWQLKKVLRTLPRWKKFLLQMLPINPEKSQKKFLNKIQNTDEPVVKIMLFKKINAAWFREILKYDPANDFPKITTPVLAITGKKDLQVPFSALETMNALITTSIETHAIDDLTHILRKDVKSTSIFRYKALGKLPLDEELLAILAKWLRKQRKRRKRDAR